MKRNKKIIIAAIIYFLVLITISFTIGRNLFIEEWKEIIISFILYIGAVYLILRGKEKIQNL